MNQVFTFYRTFFLLLCTFCFCCLASGNAENKKTFNGPTVILEKDDLLLCASWKIIEQIQPVDHYETLKDQIEEGVFYHFDDENEIITTQQNTSSETCLLKTYLWQDGNEYIISVKCCKTNLKKVKKEIQSLIKSKFTR